MKNLFISVLLGCIIALTFPYKVLAQEDDKKHLYCPEEYVAICDEMQEKYNVSSCLLLAIIQTESSCNSTVVSSEGCVGLCQVHPCNNPDGKNLYDPYTNIEIGTQVLLAFAEQSDGDLYLTLMRYHGEKDAYKKWKNGQFSPYSRHVVNMARAIEEERYVINYKSVKHVKFDGRLYQLY